MPWLPPQKAAKYAAVSYQMIYKAIYDGKLPAYVKPSAKEEPERTSSIIHTDDIDAWIRGTFAPAARVKLDADSDGSGNAVVGWVDPRKLVAGASPLERGEDR